MVAVMRVLLLVSTLCLVLVSVCSQFTEEDVTKTKKEKLEARGLYPTKDADSVESMEALERFLQIDDQVESNSNLPTGPPLPAQRGAMMEDNYANYDVSEEDRYGPVKAPIVGPPIRRPSTGSPHINGPPIGRPSTSRPHINVMEDNYGNYDISDENGYGTGDQPFIRPPIGIPSTGRPAFNGPPIGSPSTGRPHIIVPPFAVTIQPGESTSEAINTMCSNKNCIDFKGSCVEKSKHKDKCEAGICGPRSYLSPCACDANHCCCLPITCPAPYSKDASDCEQRGGQCKFKDEKCDGECLPLCGPSCSCCITGCKKLESACGKFGDGICKPNCTIDERVDESGVCDGVNCKCCTVAAPDVVCKLNQSCREPDKNGVKPKETKDCVDTKPYCTKNGIKEQCNYKEKCRKTCGVCVNEEGGYGETSADCKDDAPMCDKSICNTRPGYNDGCKKTCGVCKEECKDAMPDCDKNRYYCNIAEECKKTCGGCIQGPGIWKKSCEKDERVLNYLTPDCKCCKSNTCVDAGKNCKNGTGLIKRKCGFDEIVDHQLGDTKGLCSCCIVNPCTSPGGTCKDKNGRVGKCAQTCEDDEEPIALCPGPIGQCKCCAKKMCFSVGKVCGNNGICKEKCHAMEKESIQESAECGGKDCKCCESPVCLDLNSQCRSSNNGTGTCRESCDPNTEQADGACTGKCCYCCVPKKCMNIWEKCEAITTRFGVAHPGVCKVQCSEDETSTPAKSGQCSGTECSCCIPTLCVSVNVKCGLNDRGTCKEKCDLTKQTVDLTGSCKGIACQCCKNKDCVDEGTPCSNNNGICRPNCLHEESPSSDTSACSGVDCKCCIPQDCVSMNSTCGYGLAGQCKQKCTDSIEDDIGRCEGRKCRCCREKDCRTFGCSCGGKLNGVCKSRCDANEESVSTCEGRNCKCCTKKACDSFGVPCGGNLNGQCKPNCLAKEGEVVVGTCPGSDCKCCKKQSCDAAGGPCGDKGSGRCRASCYSSTEETVGLCGKGTNLFCCQLKKCADPGSCCDHLKDNVKVSGTCRPKCSKDEEMIAPCNGTDCKCCSPKKCENLGQSCSGSRERITEDGSTDQSGICKEKCGPDDEVIGKCGGTSCKCCGHKACTSRGEPCGEMNRGKCVAKCRENEEEIGVCAGANCRCCAIKACVQYGGPCGKNNNGTCRNRCLTSEEPTGKCKGSHCICCEIKVCKDPGQGGCSPGGGTCRADCLKADLAPNPYEDKCGSTCKCCLCQNKDANQCENNNGGCDHNCNNNEGSYTCSCYPGFYLGAYGKSCIEYLCFPRQRCGGGIPSDPTAIYGMCKTKCDDHEIQSRVQNCKKPFEENYGEESYGEAPAAPLPCMCCIAPPTPKETCPRKSCSRSRNGICKSTCSDYETEDIDGGYECNPGDSYGNPCKCCKMKTEKRPHAGPYATFVPNYDDSPTNSPHASPNANSPHGIPRKGERVNTNHVSDAIGSPDNSQHAIPRKWEIPHAPVTRPSASIVQDNASTFKSPKPWKETSGLLSPSGNFLKIDKGEPLRQTTENYSTLGGRRIPEAFLHRPNGIKRGSGGHLYTPPPSSDEYDYDTYTA